MMQNKTRTVRNSKFTEQKARKHWCMCVCAISTVLRIFYIKRVFRIYKRGVFDSGEEEVPPEEEVKTKQ